MPDFSGFNHIALTVRDLDVSQRFYCDLLDFMLVLDIGYGRLCIHRKTGFTIALLRPDGAARRGSARCEPAWTISDWPPPRATSSCSGSSGSEPPACLTARSRTCPSVIT